MQFVEFENEELFKCNCQLLQTVQNLVDKYRGIIGNGSSSPPFDDRLETVSSRPSTVCSFAEAPTTLHRGMRSPECVLSEASTQLSAHFLSGGCQRSYADSTANSACNVDAVRGVSQPIDDYLRENCGQASCSNAVAAAGHNLAVDAWGSPVRIVRIPNRMCPVHSRVDQRVLSGNGGAAILEMNYDTISVSNCWQGLKLASPSYVATANSTCSASSTKWDPTCVLLDSDSTSMMIAARSLCRKFLESTIGSLAVWSLIVMMFGSILFLLARDYQRLK